MRILITGAAGFLGSHLYERFQAGHEVVGFDNYLTGRRENAKGILELDIVERSKLYELANALEPELILHMAASYSDPDKWHRDAQTNVEGAINVAIVAKHHGARVIYPQTILEPRSSYAISKLAAEHYLRLSEVPLTVLRLANMYGPRNLSGPIPVFYDRITSGKPCMVVETTRDWVYVDDFVQAVEVVIARDLIGKFDVCTGVQTPILWIFDLVAKELGHSEDPPIVPAGDDGRQEEVLRTRRPPGWEPSTPLPEGIARTIASYRQRELGETYTHLRLKEFS
jgi:UDP-glucose 4-epimerase